ncbi:Flagella basal body P-ring formation protein FlgA [Candidatus Methylobacter favarea]|uniref:Flagella basal body P-ring formation protein FlgA n=1 Tax=Candidatus Methylobacter favarea TaxID=2707345 RepID=A0A8S0X9U6_9GAMM|nr:flagellar basal body P-ring formation chaperone FlgA [Candidatus Methylobacter favarea]CAA9892686.1 Flagella basal body P-ring formation protein FlgA [Candidatus Methylobacter favarea]
MLISFGRVINRAFPMIKNIFIMLILFWTFFAPGYADQRSQSPASISEAVKNFIAQKINTSAEYEISLIPVDSQLKLPECTEPLEAFTTTGLIKAGRNSIGIRCPAQTKWSIFTSSVIKFYQQVLVLSKPVQRGEIITSQHLALEKRDVSNLRDDFFTEAQQVENKQAIRQMPAGTILSLRNFVDPKLIKRGDKVIISAIQPAFAIRMNGIAVMDGAKGQTIRIKNQNSGRIINATVVESGLVAVNY